MLERSEKSKLPILIFIGVQGGGKTSDAKIIEKNMNALFYDGDDAIPKDSWMAVQVEKGLPVFPWQVDDFMRKHLIPALIQKRQQAIEQNKMLVVSQAIFFNVYRFLIERALGGDVYFVVVETPPKLQELQIRTRCAAQKRSWLRTELEVKSALKSNSYFEDPRMPLKSFSIDHLGRGEGNDEKFLQKLKEEFRKVAGYELPQVQQKKSSAVMASGVLFKSECKINKSERKEEQQQVRVFAR